jgi:hypothetical protein
MFPSDPLLYPSMRPNTPSAGRCHASILDLLAPPPSCPRKNGVSGLD